MFFDLVGRSLQKSSSNLIGESYDTIGLLLCVHVANRLQSLAHKRAVHVLDGYVLVCVGCDMFFFASSLRVILHALIAEGIVC